MTHRITPCYRGFDSMYARVLVTLRRGVLDPAGQAVRSGLAQLGFSEVRDVRIGKVIELQLDDMPADEARRRLEAMGQQLLANLVIEEFSIELSEGPETRP